MAHPAPPPPPPPPPPPLSPLEAACETPDVLALLAGYLRTADVVRLSGASRSLRAAVAGNAPLWRAAARRDWGNTALPPSAGPDAARTAWRASYDDRVGGLAGGDPAAARDLLAAFGAARALWGRLERWALAHYPSLALSLASGAPGHHIAEAEARLGVALPAPVRALYAIHRGQTHLGGPLAGLFGGFQVYSELCVRELLPLAEAVTATMKLRAHPSVRLHRRYVAVAGNRAARRTPGFFLSGTQGWLLVDAATGVLYAMAGDGRLLRACPPEASPAAVAAGLPGATSPDGADPYCLLRYLAEHVAALEGGLVRLARRRVDGADGDDGAAGEAADDEERVVLPPLPPHLVARAADVAATQRQAWDADFAPVTALSTFAPAPDGSDAAWAKAGVDPATVARARRLRHWYVCAWREAGRGVSHAVTRGVHVHVSRLLMPHLSAAGALGLDPGAPPPPPAAAEGEAVTADAGGGAAAVHGTQLAWTYRVRLWMDSGGSDGAPAVAPSVQLNARRWAITDPAGAEETVEGAGVIGLFPLLQPPPERQLAPPVVEVADEAAYAAAYAAATAPVAATQPATAPVSSLPALFPPGLRLLNGVPTCAAVTSAGFHVGAPADVRAAVARLRPFEYASQTALGGAPGAMRGGLVMVPGSLAAPAGPPFEAAVAPWPLDVPGFLF